MKTERYNENCRAALAEAGAVSKQLGHGFVGSEHILLALSKTSSAAKSALDAFGVTSNSILPYVDTVIPDAGRRQFTDSAGFTPDAKRVLELSLLEARSALEPLITTSHIMLSILREDGCFAARILHIFIPDFKALREKLSELNDNDFPVSAEGGTSQTEPEKEDTAPYHKIRFSDGLADDPGAASNETYAPPGLIMRSDKLHLDPKKHSDPRQKPSGGQTEGETPASDFCTDLTERARKGALDPLIGCENELDRLIGTLLRRTKNNPVLVGKPGVGKSAIVEGFASRIAEGKVPPELLNTRLLELDLALMIAGTKYRGEFEQRLKAVLESVDADTVLFIDELHMIVGAGAAEGSVDAANILKPALARGELRLIGATTFDEYRRYIEPDAALERRFSPITVEEPTREEAISILKGLRDRYESHHNVSIGNDVIAACVDQSIRCMPDRCLPDKAIDLMDETAANIRLTAAKTAENAADGSSRHAVTEADVIRVAHALSGIPEDDPAHPMNERLNDLEQSMECRFFGQNASVSAVARAVRSGFAGLSDASKPIASIIVAGGSGTGKTMLAAVLAEALYGRSSALVRFDMSDYRDETALTTLLGVPMGYIGAENGGRLSEAIRSKPYAVVLFDNIELAPRELLTLFTRLLKDGFLLDNRGRTVSFRNTVVLLSVGTGEADTHTVGFSNAAGSGSDLARVKALLPSELISAADALTVLEPIGRDASVFIALEMLSELASRARLRSITIEFGMDEAERIVETIPARELASGGAWAIKRAVSEIAEKALAESLLSGKFSAGRTYRLRIEGERVFFESVEPAPARDQ